MWLELPGRVFVNLDTIVKASFSDNERYTQGRIETVAGATSELEGPAAHALERHLKGEALAPWVDERVDTPLVMPSNERQGEPQ